MFCLYFYVPWERYSYHVRVFVHVPYEKNIHCAHMTPLNRQVLKLLHLLRLIVLYCIDVFMLSVQMVHLSLLFFKVNCPMNETVIVVVLRDLGKFNQNSKKRFFPSFRLQLWWIPLFSEIHPKTLIGTKKLNYVS